ncbi:hypothetical protein AMTRI_Chr11g151700 [Amborella trichopoda]
MTLSLKSSLARCPSFSISLKLAPLSISLPPTPLSSSLYISRCPSLSFWGFSCFGFWGSDTITQPTEAMIAAMANAEVDNDVLGFDPTAQKLKTEMARILGSELILGDQSHIHLLENGGISTIGCAHSRIVSSNLDGTMDINLIEAAIRDPVEAMCYPTTRLICLENTQAKCFKIMELGITTSTLFWLWVDGILVFQSRMCCSSWVISIVASLVRGIDGIRRQFRAIYNIKLAWLTMFNLFLKINAFMQQEQRLNICMSSKCHWIYVARLQNATTQLYKAKYKCH